MSLDTSEEIVQPGAVRRSYREFGERVHRLASALGEIGVTAGQTVAVMDWDTPRYLECFFAIPMMGAVLHTVNVRLSPEQILYTINHADDAVILVNVEFLPLLEQIRHRINSGKKFVVLSDSGEVPHTELPLEGEYEALLAAADPYFDFLELDEDTRATTFYTTGTRCRQHPLKHSLQRSSSPKASRALSRGVTQSRKTRSLSGTGLRGE